jgi:hypothetical protein
VPSDRVDFLFLTDFHIPLPPREETLARLAVFSSDREEARVEGTDGGGDAVAVATTSAAMLIGLFVFMAIFWENAGAVCSRTRPDFLQSF